MLGKKGRLWAKDREGNKIGETANLPVSCAAPVYHEMHVLTAQGRAKVIFPILVPHRDDRPKIP